MQRLGFYLIAAWAALTINFLVPRLMLRATQHVAKGQYDRLISAAGATSSPCSGCSCSSSSEGR